MPFLKFHYKPKNELEAGGRTAALLQEDASEPEKTCPNCHKAIPLSRLWSNYNTCPCGYHFRMGGRQRLRMLVDKGTFRELFAGVEGHDPLGFPGYREKLEQVQAASNETEGVLCGTARIGGQPCCLFVMEPYFMMGSMGTAVGEKITRLFEYATAQPPARWSATPSPAGHGCRRACSPSCRWPRPAGPWGGTARRGCFTCTVLTDPTTGGVTASFAMEGDIILAEPGATVGFAGARVIEQTIKKGPARGLPDERNFCSSTALWTPLSPAGTQQAVLANLLQIHAGRRARHEYPCL